MRVRRCTTLWFESREVADFDLAALLAGGTGVAARLQWFAHAGHLDAPVAIDEEELRLLGSLASAQWTPAVPLRARHGASRLRRLLQAGVLIGDSRAWAMQRAREERYRALHWHGLASAWHAASRWEGVDAPAGVEEAGIRTSTDLRALHGAPPPAATDRGPPRERIALRRARRDALDELLDARATCRNFDPARPLPLASLAQVLERAVGARGKVRAAQDFDVLKRTSPSGGGLHPTEAYVLAQHVKGLPRGLYHYRPGDHALQPLPLPPPLGMGTGAGAAERKGEAAGQGEDALARLARLAVGGQAWFAQAHALVVLAPRFGRNFWKYRNHPKAYRVAILDVGHLSQTLQVAATALGLGSFVTAAINEVDIERALGLAGFEESPMAVCGVGIRGDAMATSELDPNGKVWPRGGTTRK
ncbi:MAG: putative peptide maturation dehydrogenase [Luteimonas sp.]